VKVPKTSHVKRSKSSKSSKSLKSEKKCPDGKERNPKTHRCIKKCKSGYVRDKDFKCVKE
jgi:hypothetical protein